MHFIQGNINEDLAFEYDDDTGTRYGCGATLQNEFWYFGGYNDKRQVDIFNSNIIQYFSLLGQQNCGLQTSATE